MNTQCTQRCGRPPSKHRLSLRYRKQGSFFVGAAAVKADEGQPKDDARSSQRGAKQEKRKNTRTGAHHAENSRKKLPQDLNFLKLHARVVRASLELLRRDGLSSNEGVELHSHRAPHHTPYLLVKNRAGFFSKLFCGCKFRTWNIVHSSLRAKKVNCQRSTSWTCSWTLSSTRRSHPAWSRSHASPTPKHVCVNESIDRLTRHVDDGVIRPDLIEPFGRGL
eukprot:scaffold33250_cov65-Phaeocystis_antarctica.AAC.3